MRQLTLPIGIEAPRTFENFLPETNAEACEHLLGFAPHAAPAYLWGPSGSGKTHLLEALAHRFAGEGLRSGSFTAATAPPWSFDEGWSLVLIDECERLDDERQQAAFSLFVEAVTNGVPVVGAGRLPPVDLPLREDLRTRLGWGHVYALRPLDEADSRRVLDRLAGQRGLVLPPEVVDYLLTRYERDLKHLVARIDRLDTYSLATGRAITVPLLKQMLAQE